MIITDRTPVGHAARRLSEEVLGLTFEGRKTAMSGMTSDRLEGLHHIAEAATLAGITINVRPEVAAFARAMEYKLAVNDHKEHWREMRVHQLLEMLRDEVDELVRAVADFHDGMGHHRNVLDEAADVANFAMMVADVVALKPREIGRMEATERE